MMLPILLFNCSIHSIQFIVCLVLSKIHQTVATTQAHQGTCTWINCLLQPSLLLNYKYILCAANYNAFC